MKKVVIFIFCSVGIALSGCAPTDHKWAHDHAPARKVVPHKHEAGSGNAGVAPQPIVSHLHDPNGVAKQCEPNQPVVPHLHDPTTRVAVAVDQTQKKVVVPHVHEEGTGGRGVAVAARTFAPHRHVSVYGSAVALYQTQKDPENHWHEAGSGDAMPYIPEQFLGIDYHSLGMKARVFKPSARVFFDTGSDDKNEIDIFKSGTLDVSLTFLELYFPSGYWFADTKDPTKVAMKSWRFGPALGFGSTGPGNDSEDGEKKAGAPVVLLTAGFLLELPLGISENKKEQIVGLEVGYAQGISTDEGFGDTCDGAIYAGITLLFPW